MRGRTINMWLPLMLPLLGTWAATQACALTGNRTGNSLVFRPGLNPLSYTSQGFDVFKNGFFSLPTTRSTSSFLPYIHYENMVELQEVKIPKVCPSLS